MPTLTDRAQLAKLGKVLANWEAPRGINWLEHAKREILGQCRGLTISEINFALFQHFESNKEINRVEEKEPSLKESGKDCFYEFRLHIGRHDVYVKARLIEKDFYVVSSHKGHFK